MRDAFPYVFDILKWAVGLGGTILCAVLASQKLAVRNQIETENLKSSHKEKSDKDEQRFREVHARIDSVEARGNEQSISVAERLARLETNVERIPHVEAKLDLLIKNGK